MHGYSTLYARAHTQEHSLLLHMETTSTNYIMYIHTKVSYTLLLDWPALGHWTGHWQPGVARWNPHKPHPFRNSMGAILLGYFMVSIFNSYTNGWYMHVRVCTCTFSV